MTFSDFYLDSDLKIEILPSDKFGREKDVLVAGDSLVTVFRPVGGPFVANRLHDEFLKEFKYRSSHSPTSVGDALAATLAAFNFSCLCPPADPELRPENGAMTLVVYISPEKIATFAQVGPIALKQRKSGRFIAISKNHTFDDPAELNNLLDSDFFRKNGKMSTIKEELNSMAIGEGIIKGEPKQKTMLKGIPSRFLGHPTWCGLNGGYGETIISTLPYVATVLLAS